MPIIPTVGRKAFRIRLLIATLYIVLALGAVTMVYPFILMLSTSITSATDTNEYRLIPRYLYEERPLFAKYVDDKYAGDIQMANNLYGTDFDKTDNAEPAGAQVRSGAADVARAWEDFFRALPRKFKQAGFRGYGSHPSELAIAYRRYARELFHGDIQALNRAYVAENDTFDTVNPPMERPLSRNWSPDSSRQMQDFITWSDTLPSQMLIVVGADPMLAKYLIEDAPAYDGDLGAVRRVWGPEAGAGSVALPAEPPSDRTRRADWEGFVRNKLPFRYLVALPGAAGPYREYLRGRYHAVDRLNAAYGARYADFGAVPLPASLPDGGPVVVDWGEFIAKAAPLDALRVDTPENRFRAYLAARGMAAPTSAAYLADSVYVHDNAGRLRRDYATRNYRLVLDYILLHGRALWVTAIFCLAVIATTLLVNPLCAYALSRYALPYAYKVLLFLLATMAFPAEVAMIPNFLLLKELGLLNTYWALILPGMASGFSIFLLKGFFDSLPRELYEAGTIDGASETRMFFQITLPLSKPIFAVIALQAFTAAYGAFMFALLVCQNPRMWTLMVWLYELQINNPQYVMMAALTVAALPTLLVFLFAQNVIMRGIILPSYK